MARLIDADKAYKVLTDYYHHNTDVQHIALTLALNKVPSIDAEPVVRCKDCIYWTQTIFGCACTISFAANRITQPCDFCSFGIRKDGKQGEGLN